MTQPRQDHRLPGRLGRRSAFSYRGLLAALALGLIIVAVAWTFAPRIGWTEEEMPPMVFQVLRGPFIHYVVERGEIESANNVEVRCKVKAQGSWGKSRSRRGGRSFGGGAGASGGGLSSAGSGSGGSGYTILQIVPEGTRVQSGDVLVTLDSSALEDQQVYQEIACSASEASVEEATNRYETALMALEQYIDGSFPETRQSLADNVFARREFLRRADQDLSYNESLFATGYVTKLQVEASRFAVEKAQKDVDAALTELVCLEKYTRQKDVKGMQASIKTAKANLDSEKRSHMVNLQKLETIKTQIASCTIRAPQAGQVVYANKVGMRMAGAEIIIEEGAFVRENQVIIRLPDSEQMQIKVMVDEDNVGLVRVGQPAAMVMDAFPDLRLTGQVTKVNDYAAPSTGPSFMASFRQYETTVTIDNPPPQLRPGLTAEVTIQVEHRDDVLMVPGHAVIDHGGKHYCILEEDGRWEAREVETGSTNDKFLIIRSGLAEGEAVVMGAAGYIKKVDLPELPDAEEDAGATMDTDHPAGEKDAGEDKKQRAGPPTGKQPGPGRSAAGPNRPGQGGFDPAAIFKRLDADGDGKLSADEIPAPMKSRTPSPDKNGDGIIDRAEWTAAMSRIPRRRAGPGGGQGGGRRAGIRGGPGGGRGVP